MTTPPPMARQFFFKLSAELLEIHEADMRLNILVRVDGGEGDDGGNAAEVTNLKITGMDKEGPNPCIRVEDEDGDEFYIFMDHIISITPVEAFEEEDDDAAPDEDEETPEEDA